MILYKELESIQNLNKEIRFTEKLTEIVKEYKQTGSDRVVDFKLEIKPSDKENINIYCTEDRETIECAEHITKGVNLFITNSNQERISIKGFDIYISNCIVHAIDYRPRYYMLLTYTSLYNLAFEYGQKTIKENNRVIQNENEKLELDISKRESINTNNQFEKIIKRIHLINRNKEKISIEGNYNLDKVVQFNGDYHIEIKVFSESSERGPNYISLHILNELNSIQVSYSILEGIIKFKNDIYSHGYDLGGFSIYIGHCDNEISSHSFKEFIYWELLSLISDKI